MMEDQQKVNDMPEESTQEIFLTVDEFLEHEKTAKSIDWALRRIKIIAEFDIDGTLRISSALKARWGTLFDASEFRKAILKARQTTAFSVEPLPLYMRGENAMVWNDPKQREPVHLANFEAAIITEVLEDDGAETRRLYEIAATCEKRKVTFAVPAGDYENATWINQYLGSRAMVTVGQSMKAHLLNAIKYCSHATEITAYQHTGWREIDGHWVYLHAGGGVVDQAVVKLVKSTGANDCYLTTSEHNNESADNAESWTHDREIGQIGQIGQLHIMEYPQVRLDEGLKRYHLPEEIKDVRTAIRASLAVLDVTSDTVTMPIYASIWRAPLGEVDYGIFTIAPSGWGKTELSALAQQHFGHGMHAKALPGTWESTDNSLEKLLFQAKDAIVVIDDFKPKGARNDIDRLHAKADRIFRTLGNGAARGRLDSALNQRPERRPRCLVLSTGEDIPRGQSLKSRCVILELSEPVTKGAASQRLTAAQKDARSGLYAEAMAAYLQWLAPRITRIHEQLPDMITDMRDQCMIDGHARASNNTINMLIGMDHFLTFAVEVGAISESESSAYRDRAWKALLHVAAEAAADNDADRPVEIWRKLVITAISSRRAHLATMSGGFPGEQYGWLEVQIGTGDHATMDYRPQGDRIGWLDENGNVYIDPEAAYQVIHQRASMSGNPFTTSEKTLRKFMVKDGVLATHDLDSRKSIPIRRTIERTRKDVLHFSLAYFFPTGDAPDTSVDQFDQSKEKEGTKAGTERANGVVNCTQNEGKNSTNGQVASQNGQLELTKSSPSPDVVTSGTPAQCGMCRKPSTHVYDHPTRPYYLCAGHAQSVAENDAKAKDHYPMIDIRVPLMADVAEGA